MKKITVFCFLVFSTLTFAQGKIITGTIKDKNTQEPITGASISIVGTNTGTVSNDDGEFKITVPEENSKLRFYHLSYSDNNYEVKANSNIEILMSPREYLLNEVVVDQSPTELLNDVAKVSLEKLKAPQVLSTYYREFIQTDGKYFLCSDGLLDYHIYTTGKHKDLNSDLCVKQSRIVSFKVPDISKGDKKANLFGFINIGDAFLKVYDLASFLKLSKKHKGSSYYDSHLETKTDANGNEIGVITIVPKEDIEEEALKVGTITYDSKTKLILDIDLKYSPAHKKYAKFHGLLFGYAKGKLNDFTCKVSFKIDGDKYMMTHCQIKMSGDRKIGKYVNSDLISIGDITTLDYKEGDFKLDESKIYWLGDLWRNGNRYTQEFWKNENVRLLSDEEQKIINDLNQKSALSNPDRADVPAQR